MVYYVEVSKRLLLCFWRGFFFVYVARFAQIPYSSRLVSFVSQGRVRVGVGCYLPYALTVVLCGVGSIAFRYYYRYYHRFLYGGRYLYDRFVQWFVGVNDVQFQGSRHVSLAHQTRIGGCPRVLVLVGYYDEGLSVDSFAGGAVFRLWVLLSWGSEF